MQKRDFKFKVNQLDDAQAGSFDGLLAVYNNVDLGGDTILPGAFSRTLQANGSQVPLLWQHQPDAPIGTLKLIDGPDALRVQGQLLMNLPMAQNAYALLTNKVIRGLSIGYDVIKDTVDNNVRFLKELRLWEGSIVTFPMNEQATVTSIKSLSDAYQLLRNLRDATQPDVIAALQNINDELRRLLGEDDPEDDDDEEEEEELAALKRLAVSLKSLVA